MCFAFGRRGEKALEINWPLQSGVLLTQNDTTSPLSPDLGNFKSCNSVENRQNCPHTGYVPGIRHLQPIGGTNKIQKLSARGERLYALDLSNRKPSDTIESVSEALNKKANGLFTHPTTGGA